MMILFKRAGELTRYLQEQRAGGKEIGFVPTMGALHTGHISLIDISKKTAGITVCSIFVNPVQFNDPRDFQQYPITIENDIRMLEGAGTDILFLPELAEMYPEGTDQLEKYELGYLETILEGKYRPGHFQGVCQVMSRLLGIVQPHHLFMGQKDYQQCLVVRRLLTIMGASTAFHGCPIVREADGLAMSSRNSRLSESQRKKAPAIYEALCLLRDHYRTGAAPSMESLSGPARQILLQNDFKIDYVEIAGADTLEPLDAGKEKQKAVALVAAFLGEIRLIDNMEI